MSFDVIPFSFLLHDHRLAIPGHLDSARSLVTGKLADRVPIIRLFGYSGSRNTSAKQTCLNVHGYFPKLFCEVLPGMPSILSLAELIDRRLAGGPSDDAPATVYNISEHRRTNFYGYNDPAVDIYSIELFRPIDVSRLAELLSTPGGLTPGVGPIKVFEVHIPYLLQFLVDHGIQGVTPVMLDAKNICFTSPKTTICDLEMSVIASMGFVSLKPPSQSARKYPVPPPLATSGSNDLVCEVLQQLWEEEYQRTPPGEKFPYYPEGIADGLHRPDCSDMKWVAAKRDRVCEWASILARQETAIQPSEENTQSLVEGIGLLAQLSLAFDNDSRCDDVADRDTFSPTQGGNRPTVTPLTTTAVLSSGTVHQLTNTLVQPSVAATAVQEDIEMQEIVAEPAVAPKNILRPQTLPPYPCMLRYARAAPAAPASASASQTSVSRLSLTGQTQAFSAPQRAGKPVPVPDGEAEDSPLTFLTMVVVEILIQAAGPQPDPERDAILAIACVRIDERSEDLVQVFSTLPCSFRGTHRCFESEAEMLSVFRYEIFEKFDPTVVLSWDATRRSLGYIQTRARALSLGSSGAGSRFSLSRVLSDQLDRCWGEKEAVISGRLVVDLWRVLRNDAESGLKLGTTSLEGVIQSVLGITVPNFPDHVVAKSVETERMRSKYLTHLMKKTLLVSQLAEVTRVMPRATEMARLYGMDLESTFSRGSQFRVECMLVRASRRLGYVLPSSSKTFVKNQDATEGIPMVLEPQSGLITDPVCVLDFQSLYPSVVIAYNICFSTCLGRISDIRTVTQLGTQPGLVRNSDVARASLGLPSDVAFVQRSQRLGLIPRICHEILQTRIMVKKSMKVGNKSPALLKQLDARQLSLKLLANVIYGYTTASFSGRMPCAEIADSIVLTGRESLESVMRLAESMGGVIVYGDTDSLFVKLPGKTVDEAFVFGAELVDKVAQLHPWPMKLVHEKVYYPCCLVTKKRYVGRAFDSPNSAPRLDAKGIETIRRDTCPAVAVTIERILNAVYASVDEGTDPAFALETVCVAEFARILKGGLPLQFFVFQNQVKDITHYKDLNHLPPAARVAVDSGLSLVRGERIAYVIVQGAAGAKLSEQVKPPESLLGRQDPKRRESLNFDYYLTKQVIPAVQRIFGPLGNRAFTWLGNARSAVGSKRLVESNAHQLILASRKCLLCGSVTASSMFLGASKLSLFCQNCSKSRASQAIAAAHTQLSDKEKQAVDLRKVCLDCTGSADTVDMCCDAYYCETYFRREIGKPALAATYSDVQRIS